ncbi:MAG: hypothetical protein IJZ23_01180 [Roseburia sp.]|nr:hypothetical protein [Roseburia sp.]
MERRLKEELTRYYEAPKAQRKQAFIRLFGVQKINLPRLVLIQARYISKWVWLASVLLCGLIYGATYVMEEKYVSMVYGLVPFLVMISVTESMRSYRYGMEELELSARFSLKSIVMARMSMLGVGNLAVLIVIAIVLGQREGYHVLHVLTPYFLTAGGGLYIVRTIRGNENTFFCFTLAAAVSFLQMLLPWQFKELFVPDYMPVWAALFVIGIVMTAKESYRTIRMTEDLAWN